MALDECYSEKTQKEFANYEKSQLMMQIIHTSLFEMLLANLKAMAEKFYPAFYKSVSEVIVFKDLSQRGLGFEVANHVLAHLTGSSQGDVDFTQQVNFTSTGKYYILNI